MTESAGSRTAAVIPTMRYRDAHRAVDFLKRAFGFELQALYDGPNGTVAHAQLVLGRGMIMLGSVENGSEHAALSAQPEECGGRSTRDVYLVVADAAIAHARAQAAGAKITSALTEMDYGGKAFGCTDPEGHVWSVGEYDPWA